MRVTIPQSRKAWLALLGGVVTTAAIAWQQYGDLIPGLQPQMISAIGGLLTAISVFFIPNRPLQQAPPNGAVGLLDMTKGGKFEPTTKAPPPYTEPPGRHPGESREHH